jgi:uncharacterized membrane protein YesL
MVMMMMMMVMVMVRDVFLLGVVWECERRVYLKLAIGTGVLRLVTIAVGWLGEVLGFGQGWTLSSPR